MAKILVVEDTESLCRLYQSVLGRSGHQVILAQTGDAAVAAASQDRPDLVILDLLLPQESGVEVARALEVAGTFPAVPLIVTTALHESQAWTTAGSLGAVAVLVKPFDIQRLLTLVRETLSASGL